MRLFIDNQELNAAIATVIKAMSTRTTMQVLEGIFLEATFKDGVRMKCSDLSLQIETFVPATVEEEGVLVVPGRLFSEMVRKIPGENLTISGEGNTLTIESGRINTTIQGMPASEFPEMPFLTEEFRFNLTQRALKDMVRQCIFASAQDETKPILTGVLMELEGDTIMMVALDGYRLALRREHSSIALPGQNVVVPAKSLSEISRILLDCDDEMNMVFSKTHVLLDMGHTRIITRLLDGEFIRYKQILPTEHDTRVRLNRAELLSSIERASLMAREAKSNLVKFSFKKEELVISANSEVGRIHEELPIHLTGNEIDIAFNARYVSDVLKALDDEELYLDMTNNISPCVVRPVQGDKFYYLVLPVRLFAGA